MRISDWSSDVCSSDLWENGMSGNDDYVYDEESGEWMPASELAARKAAASQIEVRDAVGNLLQDGDSVALIKDLEVKGAGKTLKEIGRASGRERVRQNV